MRLSILFSAILVLAASILTYAAPYGTPRTFLDIEQRSTHPHHVHGSTSAVSASGSHQGTGPSETGVGREVMIITRPLAGSNSGIPPPTLLKHWAVMVGSHYYELFINNQVPNQETCSASLHGAAIEMHVGDTVPGLSTGGWNALGPQGLTHYSDAEIRQAGERVMKAMSARNYHIITNNCQDFANQLSKCIVTPKDRKKCCIIC